MATDPRGINRSDRTGTTLVPETPIGSDPLALKTSSAGLGAMPSSPPPSPTPVIQDNPKIPSTYTITMPASDPASTPSTPPTPSRKFELQRQNDIQLEHVYYTEGKDGKDPPRKVVRLSYKLTDAQVNTIKEACARVKALPECQNKIIKTIDFKYLTAICADGNSIPLQLDDAIEDLRQVYEEIAQANSIRYSWPPAREGYVGDLNGRRALRKDTERTIKMGNWELGKCIEKFCKHGLPAIEFKDPRVDRCRRVDHFLKEMSVAIQDELKKVPLKEGESTEDRAKRNKLFELIKLIEGCDQFALYASILEVDGTILEKIIKNEKGNLQDGFAGKFGFRNKELTAAEKHYICDIGLLRAKNLSELYVLSDKLYRDVATDSFERLISHTLESGISDKADAVEKAKKFFEHPLLAGLGLTDELGGIVKRILAEALTQVPPPPSP